MRKKSLFAVAISAGFLALIVSYQNFTRVNVGALSNQQTAFGDVNGDGLADMLTRDMSSGRISVAVGTEDGLTASSSLGMTFPNSFQMFVADVTGDALADLIGWNVVNGQIYVYASDGNTFVAPSTLSAVQSVRNKIYFADVTGDGTADLIVWDQQTQAVAVYPVVEARIGAAFAFGTASISSSLSFADVNGDGMADLISYSPNAGKLTVGLSSGAGVERVYIASGAYPSPFYFADVNGDGADDLLVRNPSNNSIWAYASENDDFMNGSSFASLSSSEMPLGFADVDGDGEVDLIHSSTSVAPSPAPSKSPAAAGTKSALNWTFKSTSYFNEAIENLSGQCASRRKNFEKNYDKAVSVIKMEGVLPGDPNIAKYRNVIEGLNEVLNVAFCAKYAATSGEQRASLDTVTNYIKKWENNYVGDGNPINDSYLIPLLLAGDFVTPMMTNSERNVFQRFVEQIDNKERAFMADLKDSDSRKKNNWMAIHLALRSYAVMILGKNAGISLQKTAVHKFVNNSYDAPAKFKLSDCSNLRAIGVYGSYDLQERDAFHYHAKGLAALVPFLSQRPGFISSSARAKLVKAMNTFKPYVLKQKSHKEFICSSVAYDKKKIDLDPSFKAPWDPNDDSVLFRYGRVGMSEIKSWTKSFVNPSYHPWVKVYATGKGDSYQ